MIRFRTESAWVQPGQPYGIDFRFVGRAIRFIKTFFVSFFCSKTRYFQSTGSTVLLYGTGCIYIYIYKL